MKLTREVKTGIIAIIIIAGAIWGYNFLKGKNILSPTDEYFVAYDRIDGIIESGAVYYHGYQIGNITEISFDHNNPTNFYLRIVLQKGFKVPIGTKVMAKETNLIAGAKDLQLIFSEVKEFHQPGDTLLPAYDAGIMGILDPLQEKFDSLIVNLNTALQRVSITLDDSFKNKLDSTLSSIALITDELSKSLRDNGDLGKTLANLETLSAELAENSESIGNIITNFEGISSSLDSAQLDQTVFRLDSTLASTNEIMAKINNSQGTAGLIVNDSTLYMNLASATSSLDSLFIDLKEHPKRYVQFSLFGGKDKSEKK